MTETYDVKKLNSITDRLDDNNNYSVEISKYNPSGAIMNLTITEELVEENSGDKV